jgi:hypothetical protein
MLRFNAQQNKYTNYGPPLSIPLVFAANFGELRSNHFHMGVDYKTNGAEGVKILAVEDGYVSRVKVSTFGYGKVIYINHPNGITSVYAHCSKFLGDIDSLVKLIQSKEQNFEIDYYPKPNEVKITKGQNIALSGNTGSSTGPHLHFELRDTKTETALNPLLFGFDIKDHKKPILSHMKIYSVTNEGYINSNETFKYNLISKNNILSTELNVIDIPISFFDSTGGIAFSFDVYDPYDLSYNKLGIYGSDLSINGFKFFQTKIDSISFDETRYINSHTDFHEFSVNKRDYHKSFKTIHNPLSIYTTKELGYKKVNIGDTLDVSYIVFDTKQNESLCKFKIVIVKNEKTYTLKNFENEKYLKPENKYEISNDEKSIFIEVQKGTFYEPEIIQLKSTKNSFSFGSKSIPIQKPLLLKVIKPDLDSLTLSKYYITVNSRFLERIISKDTIISSSKYLGEFKIKQDTVLPVLNQISLTSNKNIQLSTVKWKIYDNNSGLKDYDLYIDNKWYLLEYEHKNNIISFQVPNEIKGLHNLKIIAIDNVGNEMIWESEYNFL